MKIQETTLAVTGDGDEMLLLHNGQLADRQCEWTRQLAAVTSKRKKTDEDALEVARLEWCGSLYHDPEIGTYMPGDNFRRALLDAARLSKEGKNIERGLLKVSRRNQLQYEGPRDMQTMWDSGLYAHRTTVKVGTSKVVRTRPKFVGWSFNVEVGFDTTIISQEDLVRIAKTAGNYIGIGDGRPFYAGRFEVELATP